MVLCLLTPPEVVDTHCTDIEFWLLPLATGELMIELVQQPVMNFSPFVHGAEPAWSIAIALKSLVGVVFMMPLMYSPRALPAGAAPPEVVTRFKSISNSYSLPLKPCVAEQDCVGQLVT